MPCKLALNFQIWMLPLCRKILGASFSFLQKVISSTISEKETKNWIFQRSKFNWYFNFNSVNVIKFSILFFETINLLYQPPARKLIFLLQLTVAQCSILRYRGIKCKNWTAHAPIAMQRSTIFFLFFLQR